MKQPKFKKIKSSIKKATAEKEASEQPKKFMAKMTEPNIKKVKGIAF